MTIQEMTIQEWMHSFEVAHEDKEEWIHSYEMAVEDISHEKDIEREEAEKILHEKLLKDPSFLNGYLAD